MDLAGACPGEAFGREELAGRDLAALESLEWVVANGRGGYAMGTVAGSRTRRYHGLLMAALSPPVRRHLLLAAVEEWVELPSGERFPLSTHRYPGSVHPDGFRHLTGFRLRPFPTWVYEAGRARVERSLFLVHGEETAVVRWRLLEGPEGARVRVRPFIAFREDHALTHENGALRGAVQERDGALAIEPYQGLPPLFLRAEPRVPLSGEPHWFRRFQYEEERARGLDFEEDLWSPGELVLPLAPGGGASLHATLEDPRPRPAEALAAAEAVRQAALIEKAGSPAHPFLRALVLAADQFLVDRPGGRTVIAGYPWFTDWGRDTMIAIPGLTLATGRAEEAAAVLRAFAAHVSEGMIPNRFPDRGEPPEYNTVDATLWMFVALWRTFLATKDRALAKELYPTLAAVIAAHEKGTRYGIRVDPQDGLLAQGDEGAALTWMDARVDGRAVTARRGKAVEINALYANALAILGEIASSLGDSGAATRYRAAFARTRKGFLRAFWDEKGTYLKDLALDRDGDRANAVRPNAVLALGLPFPLLEGARAEQALDVLLRELETRVGLRTLSPRDPGYRPRYEGGSRARDEAYHQGAVWPWLTGALVDACLRCRKKPGARAEARALLAPLYRHLGEAGLGQVSELFDPEEPHRPRGCPAQAWSVAEPLRALSDHGLAAGIAAPA